MTNHDQSNRLWLTCTIVGFVSATLMAVGIGVGFQLGQSSSQSNLISELPRISSPLRLQADSAASGKSMSLATGNINGDVEALFILDHLTADLQCWLLNPKTGDVGGIYKTNVAGMVTGDKGDADFVMTTGAFYFDGAKGGVLPAQSIVYIAEGNSGKVAGFSFNYNRSEIQRGIVQTGELTLVCEGVARDVMQRDQ
jgi:hypothetical protein